MSSVSFVVTAVVGLGAEKPSTPKITKTTKGSRKKHQGLYFVSSVSFVVIAVVVALGWEKPSTTKITKTTKRAWTSSGVCPS